MIGASHEALVESFESIWQSASSSAPDLQSFLRDHASAIATTDQDSLLCDLAEIDLEWRWRLAEKRYPRISWKQYATVMKLGATHALRLAQRELLVRIRWGDNPLIRELGDGTEDQHWAQEMGRVLTQRYPMIASVLHDGQPILRTVVPFRSSWGRQSATEPPAPTVVQDPPHFVRVLFARREENRVSRKQFHLTRAGYDRLELDTSESSVSINYQNRSIAPQQVTLVNMPVVLAVGAWSFRIDFA